MVVCVSVCKLCGHSVQVLTNRQSRGELCAGHCLSFFGDNAGVVGSMIRGSSKAQEINALTSKMWMHVACDDIAIMIYRAKSESNPADGPSRGKFGLMSHLCAEEAAPKFLPGACDLWSIPSIL